jgi:hypothetical protein
MAQAQDATLQHLTERWRWEVACKDDMRVERRLYHKLVIEGVNRRDEGALLDDCFPLMLALGVVTLVEHAAAQPSRARCARSSSLSCATGGRPCWGLSACMPCQADCAVMRR